MGSASPSPAIELTVRVGADAATTAVLYPAEHPAATLILGHGAGAGQRSAFMVAFARAIAERGVTVVTFNFLYTEQRRHAPDRPPILESCYRAVIAAVRERVKGTLFIGGKSMGGRIATQVAAADASLDVAGLVLFGYPLHPPGRPEQRRDAHLPDVGRPMLFVQGSRDTFGTPAELEPIVAATRATLHVVPGGDHSFKLSSKKPEPQAQVYEDIQRTTVDWIATITSRSSPSLRRP